MWHTKLGSMQSMLFPQLGNSMLQHPTAGLSCCRTALIPHNASPVCAQTNVHGSRSVVMSAAASGSSRQYTPSGQQEGSSRRGTGSGPSGKSRNRYQPGDQQQQQQQQRQHHSGQQQQQQGQLRQQGHYKQRQQLQPVPLFQGGSSSSSSSPQPPPSAAAADPVAVSALLTHRISSCDGMQQLLEVLGLHTDSLGPVHISAAFSKAAKLHPGLLSQRPPQRQQQQQHSVSPQQLRTVCDQLLQRFMSQLPQAGMVELSCVVGGLARLGYDCQNDSYGRDVIDAVLDASRALMLLDLQQLQQQQQPTADGDGTEPAAAVAAIAGVWEQQQQQQEEDEQQQQQQQDDDDDQGQVTMENKVLLQLAWGLARLGRKPDQGWLAAFEAQTLARMSSFNNIETANLLWVFAKWGVAPSSPNWLPAFLPQLSSQLLLLQPTEICSVLWAAAMSRIRLPVPLMDSLLLEAQVKFGGFSGQGFGTLTWSLARMDIKPKKLWVQDLLRHSLAALPGLSTAGRDQSFTNIIWALGCWEHTPPTAWLQEYCRCVVPQLRFMTSQGLAIVAVGLAELHHRPPIPFSCYLLELFHKQLPAAPSPQQAAAFIWALPRLLLQTTHSKELSAAVSAAKHTDASSSSSSSSTNTLLGQQQGMQAADEAAAAAGAGAAGLSTRLLTGATFRWLRQYCWLLQDIADVILSGLHTLSPTDLVDCVAGFADLGFFPGEPWMDCHESNLNRQLDQLSTLQISLVKHAYMRLEQVQVQQQALLQPELQALLLQQQQRGAAIVAAAASAGSPASGTSISSSHHHMSSSNGNSGWRRAAVDLSASAAAAAASTAAVRLGASEPAAAEAAAAAAGRRHREEGEAGASPELWQVSLDNESRMMMVSSRGRGSRGRGGRGSRGRGSRGIGRHYDSTPALGDAGGAAGGGFGLVEQPAQAPQLPRKPRAARIRLQKIREAEQREAEQQQQQQEHEWQQSSEVRRQQQQGRPYQQPRRH